MKPFRLDPCLKIRRHREECEEIRLGELIQDTKDLESRIQAVDRSRSAAQSELSDRTDMVAAEALMYQYYFTSLNQKQLELLKRREELAGRVDQQRRKLVEASRDRKVVEKLKERFVTQQKNELERKEQLEIEDLYLQGKIARRNR